MADSSPGGSFRLEESIFSTTSRIVMSMRFNSFTTSRANPFRVDDEFPAAPCPAHRLLWSRPACFSGAFAHGHEKRGKLFSRSCHRTLYLPFGVYNAGVCRRCFNEEILWGALDGRAPGGFGPDPSRNDG